MEAIQIEQLGGRRCSRPRSFPIPSRSGRGGGPGGRSRAQLRGHLPPHGLYPHPLPFVPARRGAGWSRAGPDVADLAIGDRIAWTDCWLSAELVSIAVARAVTVPNDVGMETAAAAMLQGMTAHYLVNDPVPGPARRPVLIYAAAEGWAPVDPDGASQGGGPSPWWGPRRREVAQRARGRPCDRLRRRRPADQVESVAGKRRMAVVYDGVGAATFETSLRLLRRRGMLVAFGNASGPVPPIDVLTLSATARCS